MVLEGLLELPVLYLSHFIIRNKATYYSFLQGVRDEVKWEK
jgi:Fic family protein